MFVMLGGGLLHMVIWVNLTDGLYYSGQLGIGIILAEMIALTLCYYTSRQDPLI
jgi:hypothetical protein